MQNANLRGNPFHFEICNLQFAFYAIFPSQRGVTISRSPGFRPKSFLALPPYRAISSNPELPKSAMGSPVFPWPYVRWMRSIRHPFPLMRRGRPALSNPYSSREMLVIRLPKESEKRICPRNFPPFSRGRGHSARAKPAARGPKRFGSRPRDKCPATGAKISLP